MIPMKKLSNDTRAFTGLEAAIVLIAFVVVAAVFSYVMLGAGFYTTQKSQEVVHTGVEQASSSIELTGDVIATGNTTSDTVANLTLFLQLTAGGHAVDLNKTLVTYTDQSNHDSYTIDDAQLTRTNAFNGDSDYLIEKYEKFEITLDLSSYNLGVNEKFQVEIKPPDGASYTLERSVPAQIDGVMTLY
ncbi:flagellin FlaB [Methanohalophilus levihalophilus]|uniref:archaellin/type IV pilin N-terminal domain-containing protein n=1 Tax=Methanohalophilus levihalophilus TaxID=1431282 RepID=UPI001FD8AF47|nr:archaellin/type IV pilin N-terminal domain-containing protein [Methanohalophilus levihalophilus]MBP2029980.1 flagellin FlaB [Methanohalophilus levihalophilus]